MGNVLYCIGKEEKECQATITSTPRRRGTKTARYVLETGKPATSVAEELGINTNTVCKWVREYRRNHELPSYAEEKGIVKKEPQAEGEMMGRIKDLERELRKKEKELSDEKSLHIFMQRRE